MDDNNSTPPPPPDLSFSPHTPTPTHNFLYSTTAAAAVSAAAASTNPITFPSPLTIIPSTATPPTVPNPIPLQSHPPFKHQTKPRKKRSKLLRTETAGQHAGTSCSAVASAPQSAPPKPPKTGLSKKPDPSAPKITEPCTECGKTFWSWKALFGHMRCHPERQWRGINPPPQFRARREGPPNSSTASNINVGTASSSHVPPSTRTTSAAAAAMTADDYEVSSCLLLLAAGGGTCTIPATSTSNVVDYRSDHPSGALNNMALVPFDQPPPEISSRQADMGEAAGTSSIQKAGTSSVTAAYDAHHIVEELSAATTSGGGFTTRFECSSCKKTFGSHQALGGHRASHKNVKGCFAITRTADQPADQEITYYDRGTAGSSAAYHHWQDNVGSEGAGGGEAGTGLGSDMGLGLALGFGGGGGHRCGICMRVFSSGQALGGHKRCHWEKGSEDGGGGGSGGGSDPAAAVVELGHGIGSSSTSGTRDWSGVGDGLDLNFFPAPSRGCDHDHPSLTASTSAAAASSSADLQLDLRLGR